MKFVTTAITFICCITFAFSKVEVNKTPQSEPKEPNELKKHPHLTLKIDSIGIDDQLYAINFNYEGKIKQETGLLLLNDSIAVNVIYLKMKIVGETTYFDNVSFYTKNREGIWSCLSFVSLFTFTPGSYHDGWGSMGTPGFPGYFRYKIHMKFTK